MIKVLYSNIDARLGFLGVRPGAIKHNVFIIPNIEMVLMADEAFHTKIADFWKNHVDFENNIF